MAERDVHELRRRYLEAEAKQRELAVCLREYRQAGFPLLAEWYDKECRRLGCLMLSLVDVLQSLDKKG